eukprot:TRINITY_DN65439_c0_g1_i1.p1 TRINITY_DN65439_c0_g1~~TRINITY_DN65439_c0_g1_i1.p1  ORF type:complete len:341 (+),score=48.79 TRINITY_DN65439_c0_g1_i1:154-1023(+)
MASRPGRRAPRSRVMRHELRCLRSCVARTRSEATCAAVEGRVGKDVSLFQPKQSGLHPVTCAALESLLWTSDAPEYEVAPHSQLSDDVAGADGLLNVETNSNKVSTPLLALKAVPSRDSGTCAVAGELLREVARHSFLQVDSLASVAGRALLTQQQFVLVYLRGFLEVFRAAASPPPRVRAGCATWLCFMYVVGVLIVLLGAANCLAAFGANHAVGSSPPLLMSSKDSTGVLEKVGWFVDFVVRLAQLFVGGLPGLPARSLWNAAVASVFGGGFLAVAHPVRNACLLGV